MTELFSRADLWVIFLYLGFMIWIGWRVTDGSRDVEGYTVGNRSMNGWVVGLSVLGTFLSSITFLGVPARVIRERNWSTFAFGAALPFAALVAVYGFIPLYRRKLNLSVYELLEQRFGYWARAYAGLSYSVLQLFRIAMVNLLVALAVEPLLQWGIVTTLLIVGLVVIVYDVMGGIKAVIWTDVVQVFVLLGGALWCLVEIARRRTGGLSQLIADVPTGHMGFEPWSSWNLAASTTLVVFIYGISENLRNYGTDQNYVQRMLASRDDREAAKSIWFGALAYLPLNVLFCFMGTALYVFYAVPVGGAGEIQAGTMHTPLPAEVLSGRTDLVFPHFLNHELSPLARGIVIAGILAAAMSTVDSCLNSTSMTLFVDFYQRLRRQPGRLSDILTIRIFTAVLGLAGTGLAIAIFRSFDEKSRTLMDLWWKYAGVAGSGLFGLFLLAWLTPRIPSWCALTAVLAGIPVIVWGMLDDKYLHANLVGIAGFSVMIVVGGLFALGVRLGWIEANSRS